MTKSTKQLLESLSKASLSRKILIAIVTIVLILSAVTLLFIDQGVRRQVDKNILTQLDAAATAYVELNDAKLEQVLARTQFFVQNPVFQRDMRGAPATSARIVTGFKKLTEFDFLMAVNFSGRVLVDSIHPEQLGKTVPAQYQDLLQKTVENGRYLGMWSENGRLYQLVGLPLLGFDAVLLAVNEVTDKFAYKIDELSRNQITFFIGDKVVAPTETPQPRHGGAAGSPPPAESGGRRAVPFSCAGSPTPRHRAADFPTASRRRFGVAGR